MLKVLLYGLATFMETGIGVWIFSQTFSERRILEKKYYVLEWLLYSLIFFGIYNFSVSLWQIDKKIEKYVIKVICIYIIGLIAGIIYDIFFVKKKEMVLRRILYIGMIFWLTAQYWAGYQSLLMIILGSGIIVLYVFCYFDCTFKQAYVWNFFYAVNIGLIKEAYVVYAGVFNHKQWDDFYSYPRGHTYQEVIFWILGCLFIFWIIKFILSVNSIKGILRTRLKELFIIGLLECCIRLVTILYSTEKICYTPSKTVLEDANMPRYIVTLTNDEIQELKAIIQKGGKGYRIKHAQILLKLDQKPENKAWTYDRIKDAYGAARSTIAGIAQRFVMGGMEAALGRKVQENRRRKVTGDVEARICAIACSEPPEGASRWTMQAIADELIRLEVVDYITDSTVCEVMKKMKSSRGS